MKRLLLPSAMILCMSVATSAKATEDGQPIENCAGCHYGRGSLRPTVRVLASPMDLALGASTDIVVEVVEPNASGGGVYVRANGGTLVPLDPGQLRQEALGFVHMRPEAMAGGVATFGFRFEAPEAPGVTRLEVSAVAANLDKDPENDSYATAYVDVAYGCEAISYYPDIDADGYGNDLFETRSCTPVPAYVTTPGDCADTSLAQNPSAPELCNLLDDDCDGELDNGLEPSLLYVDEDGDGFGERRSTASFGCLPSPGFAGNQDDCDDADSSLFPSAVEFCNGIDDDCDSIIDDDCVEEPAAESASASPNAGCSVGPGRAGISAAGASALGLLVMLLGARRASRRRLQPASARK